MNEKKIKQKNVLQKDEKLKVKLLLQCKIKYLLIYVDTVHVDIKGVSFIMQFLLLKRHKFWCLTLTLFGSFYFYVCISIIELHFLCFNF